MFDFNKPNIEITEISEDKKYGRFVVDVYKRQLLRFQNWKRCIRKAKTEEKKLQRSHVM